MRSVKQLQGSCQREAYNKPAEHIGACDLRMLERQGGHHVAHISTTTTPERSPMDSGAPLTKCRSEAGTSGQEEPSDMLSACQKPGSAKLYNCLNALMSNAGWRAGARRDGGAGRKLAGVRVGSLRLVSRVRYGDAESK